MAVNAPLDVDSLCHEYVSGESAQGAPKQLANGIADGKVDLLTVVEALGIYLTSTVIQNRSRGTRLLSEVLSYLHSHQLPPDDVHYLVVFYCDRLKDRAVIIPTVLFGLHALVTHQSLTSEDVVAVSRAIFKEVHNQSMQQSDRRLVYNIMETFLTAYLEAVKSLGSEFVLGYIQAMDGEKDPRNLVIAFRSVHTIIAHLQFDVLTEDLFEVTSCYFPIDFTAPSDDPYATSCEQLVLELRRCLTATPKFAEFVLPLLLEKLSSDIQSAKLDSLQTLAAGACTYGAEGLSPFLSSLWLSVRREVFQAVNRDVEEACLNALTEVTRALSSPLLSHGEERGIGGLEGFVQTAVKDLKRHLCEPELRLMRPAGSLLLSVARGSDLACATIVGTVVPLLLEQYTTHTQITNRKVILQVLLDFIKVVRVFSRDEEVSRPLSPYKDQMIALLLTALGDKHAPLTVVAITTIFNVLKLDHFLLEKEVSLCADHLKGLALKSSNASVRKESSQCLAHLATLHPDIVKEALLPSLISALTEGTPMEVDQFCSPPSVVNILHLLACLCSHPSLLRVTLPAILDYLLWLAREPFSVDNVELAMAGGSSALEAVEAILEMDDHRTFSLSFLSEHVVGRVIGMCVEAAIGRDSESMIGQCVLTEESVLEKLASVLKCYSQALDASLSQTVMLLVLGVFKEGQVETVGVAAVEGMTFQPLEPTSPPCQTQLVSILTATAGALRPEVVSLHCRKLLTPLLHLSTVCTHPPSSLHATKCYASIVNKMKGPDFTSRLEGDMELVWRLVTEVGNDGNTEGRARALTLWIWLTKALVMSGHTCGRAAALKLLSLFGDPDLGLKSADGFQLILSDRTDVLNRRCHAVVRLMYKQQIFIAVVPEVVRMFHQGSPGEKQHLLKALSHLMQGVPKQVLVAELPLLIPLLLESLRGSEEAAGKSGEGDGVRLSTLEALLSLLLDAPQPLVEHVPSLLPRLLELGKTAGTMTVRMTALKCVGAMTILPLHVIYPYQAEVLHDLKVCLDDRKRLVRGEAVQSRTNWFSLGTT